MLSRIKRVAISLLASGITLVAAFQIVYRLGLADAASSPHDGQAEMSAFFGAVFIAPAVALMMFALVFRLSRKWLPDS